MDGKAKSDERGPWQDEPDELNWNHKGMRLHIERCSGHLNGYVRLKKGHPFFGKDYDHEMPELLKAKDKMLKKPMPGNPSFALMIDALSGELRPCMSSILDVHGGVTYAGQLKGGEKEWWVGFDTGHLGDIWPDPHGLFPREDGAYRDLEYVKAETEKLAGQLHLLSK